jgi:hypothetical protein
MAIRAVFVCLAAIMVMGCSARNLVLGENRGSARGILYSSSIEPYSQDFHNTPVGEKSFVVNSYMLEVRISGEWDTDEIMRLAREEGITDLHYIDIKTLSVLRGLYRRQTLIVYGD